ncbi:MAG: 1-acyl-sn-glycerol-3-phosphate acyltransferase [Alphaproteobacteria bacterium]|nr:1-acyl-sn-glycerol-3-phosphate acyltransferase [Alphaproteobacteria bacterium]MBU0797321.1 1-acyl-sn-glycerol-3-phosphate acyltransferase [Alphaproteobacteria bacterium]MBU0888891.1 1-acyl-sn-glycerol-3-phosphate acyltransferase [Alphaproteobacteria bacterium]MBU1813911.1 1-acyl-sn-glycerol-3-phosphate acyltransferase [Alphaproteobacteria bacterium]
MTWLRSLLFYACFYVWSALINIGGLPLLAGPPGVVTLGQRAWAWGVLVLLRYVAGLHYEVRGRENLPDGPYIIAAKHQSAWETIVFFKEVAYPAYVLKKELLKIPLYGWYAKRARHIVVDREGGSKALRNLLADSKVALERGMVPIIFPQGTRTAPGAVMPYQSGIAAMYKGLGVPVVPVALNSGLFWGRVAFLKKPGTIVLEYLPPIAPGLDKASFMAELEARTEAASEKLLVEGRREAP